MLEKLILSHWFITQDQQKKILDRKITIRMQAKKMRKSESHCEGVLF